MLLHISDLHIGRDLNGYSLINDQAHALKQIINIIKENGIKYLLISGDIYDKYNPINDAVLLFEEFLIEISNLNIRTIIITGNHDSRLRVSYLKSFLKKDNVFIFSDIKKDVEYIEFADDKISFLPIPFVSYNELRSIFDSQKSNTEIHKMIIDSYFEKANKDYKHICLCHNMISGTCSSDSERTISMGGLDDISRSIFKGFDYTALGHLHLKQNLGNNIYYCGSLLKYSVSEFNNKNSVNIFNLETNELKQIELIPLRNCRVIKDTFDNIYENAKTDLNRKDYISIELLDDNLIYDVFIRLSVYYPYIVSIKMVAYQNLGTNDIEDDIVIDNKDELEIFSDFYKNQLKKDLSLEAKDYMRKIINSIKEES